MNDILKELKNCNNKVYKYFWEKSKDFIEDLAEKGLITQTIYRKTKSENSFSFKKLDGSELETLKEIFGDINEGCFESATKGQGNELERILTMHSSALLGLLFFNSVSEENPLSIEIGENRYEFTSADFEFKNPCLKKDVNGNEYRPSCIDIKLTDKKQNTVLFLESKLSEYLHNGKQTGISLEYKRQYADIFKVGELTDELTIKEENGSLTLTTKDGRCSHYCQGIKQMMCHFIGAMNYMEETEHKEGEVLLGTILLDLSSIAKTSYDRYCNDYEQLADKLTKLGKGVKMIGKPFTYQCLYTDMSKGFKLSDQVVEYYGLNK